jgi:hypothetical protein
MRALSDHRATAAVAAEAAAERVREELVPTTNSSSSPQDHRAVAPLGAESPSARGEIKSGEAKSGVTKSGNRHHGDGTAPLEAAVRDATAPSDCNEKEGSTLPDLCTAPLRQQSSTALPAGQGKEGAAPSTAAIATTTTTTTTTVEAQSPGAAAIAAAAAFTVPYVYSLMTVHDGAQESSAGAAEDVAVPDRVAPPVRILARPCGGGASAEWAVDADDFTVEDALAVVFSRGESPPFSTVKARKRKQGLRRVSASSSTAMDGGACVAATAAAAASIVVLNDRRLFPHQASCSLRALGVRPGAVLSATRAPLASSSSAAATGRLLGGAQTLEQWLAKEFAGVDLATVTKIEGVPGDVTGECVWWWWKSGGRVGCR